MAHERGGRKSPSPKIFATRPSGRGSKGAIALFRVLQGLPGGGPPAALLPLLEDPDPGVRAEAVMALRRSDQVP